MPRCLLAAVLPYFLNLGVSSIWDANEAFYAQTPREMIETGDYVTPSFNFQLRMNKPVLSYWNVAASYHLFGISEWSERLPIAIGALVIIGTAFGLGRLLGGTFAGLFAALVLATSPRLVLLARRIIIDIHITMWTGLVLLCLRACRDEAAAAPAVSVPDVRGGRLRRADERAGRGVSAGRRVLHLPRVAEAARRSAAHDAADRRAHQPGHRRAVVLLSVSRARMGIHRVVHLRREPRPLRRTRSANNRAACCSTSR